LQNRGDINKLSHELAQLVSTQAGAMTKKLDKTIDQLHWGGHNVIYSAASLLAIHELKG
jgi:hypothetical protein